MRSSYMSLFCRPVNVLLRVTLEIILIYGVYGCTVYGIINNVLSAVHVCMYYRLFIVCHCRVYAIGVSVNVPDGSLPEFTDELLQIAGSPENL